MPEAPDDAGPRDWDAATYDRVAAPMTRWGADVLDRLPLHGDEIVLDAGCGTGRVTERLLERLPVGRAIALDGSSAMVEAARARLGRFGNRVEFVVADLGAPLPLTAASVDVVLSTATFHWIPDHDALFAHLADVLRPGGRLVAQCGGQGNIARVRAALDAVGDGWAGPWIFASPEETRRRLERAGFVDIETWLVDAPTQLEQGEPLRNYLRTVVLGAHIERLPQSERDALVDDVAARLDPPVIDYVRLNIDATLAPND